MGACERLLDTFTTAVFVATLILAVFAVFVSPINIWTVSLIPFAGLIAAYVAWANGEVQE